MKVKVTITLDDGRWQRLRIQALKEKTSASEIIDRLIAEYLKTAKKGGD
jgi:predicted CopG family antitoxin